MGTPTGTGAATPGLQIGERCLLGALRRDVRGHGVAAVHDHGERLAVVGLLEGRLPAHQHVEDDAQAPDICKRKRRRRRFSNPSQCNRRGQADHAEDPQGEPRYPPAGSSRAQVPWGAAPGPAPWQVPPTRGRILPIPYPSRSPGTSQKRWWSGHEGHLLCHLLIPIFHHLHAPTAHICGTNPSGGGPQSGVALSPHLPAALQAAAAPSCSLPAVRAPAQTGSLPSSGDRDRASPAASRSSHLHVPPCDCHTDPLQERARAALPPPVAARRLIFLLLQNRFIFRMLSAGPGLSANTFSSLSARIFTFLICAGFLA